MEQESENLEDRLILDRAFLFSLVKEKAFFSEFSFFERETPLFLATISALSEQEEIESVVYIYDALFAAFLKKISLLPCLENKKLLRKIKRKKSIQRFENVSKVKENLVLSLAWDRFCVGIEELFDHPSREAIFLKNLEHLRSCLIESYQHIVLGQKINISFFRLVNTLFYYEMREERLSLHSLEDWEILTKSFPVLLSFKQLSSAFYIDDLFFKKNESPYFQVPTKDPYKIVLQRIDLANLMLKKIESTELK